MKIPDIIIEAARYLRKNMTESEKYLWQHIKGNSLGYKVLRQKPIRIYTENDGTERYIIADFYIPERNIIIEVDGGVHNETDVFTLDREKEKLLKQRGYSIIRFMNTEILNDVAGVLNIISSLLEKGRCPEDRGDVLKKVQSFLNTPSDKKKIIVIYGPTGSGKTDMSIEIAKSLDTEIISTDSRQIFQGMDIGTGKITPEETQGVIHHMIDIILPSQTYSVGEFQLTAQKIVERLHSEGKVPMLVGGTGLYIDSIILERAFGQLPSDEDLRKSFASYTTQELYDELNKIDPDYALEIHPNNRPYIERALEVKKISGKSKRDFRSGLELKYDVLFLTPVIENEDDIFSERYRELLYNRINRRVEMMLDMGLVEEVEGLLKQGYSERDFGMKSIGYSEFYPYFRGETELSDICEKIQQHSRNYAKRQLTWFRKYSTLKRY